MPVVSVSMPESLLEELDTFIEEHGYSGRSEAVREGARGLLTGFDDRELGVDPTAADDDVDLGYGGLIRQTRSDAMRTSAIGR